jgi:hypothetical protein
LNRFQTARPVSLPLGSLIALGIRCLSLTPDAQVRLVLPCTTYPLGGSYEILTNLGVSSAFIIVGRYSGRRDPSSGFGPPLESLGVWDEDPRWGRHRVSPFDPDEGCTDEL